MLNIFYSCAPSTMNNVKSYNKNSPTTTYHSTAPRSTTRTPSKPSPTLRAPPGGCKAAGTGQRSMMSLCLSTGQDRHEKPPSPDPHPTLLSLDNIYRTVMTTRLAPPVNPTNETATSIPFPQTAMGFIGARSLQCLIAVQLNKHLNNEKKKNEKKPLWVLSEISRLFECVHKQECFHKTKVIRHSALSTRKRSVVKVTQIRDTTGDYGTEKTRTREKR